MIIEASSLLLDTTITEKRSHEYNKFYSLITTITLTIYTKVIQSYLAYITRVFLMSFPIVDDSGPSYWNTLC